jgi:hypothetical protein
MNIMGFIEKGIAETTVAISIKAIGTSVKVILRSLSNRRRAASPKKKNAAFKSGPKERRDLLTSIMKLIILKLPVRPWTDRSPSTLPAIGPRQLTQLITKWNQ